LGLIEETPELEADIKEHKKAIDEMIVAAFTAVRAERDGMDTEMADPVEQSAASPVKKQRSPDYEATTSQPVPLKKAQVKPMTDEELARQLDRTLNNATSSRPTRNGRTRRASTKAAGKKRSGGGGGGPSKGVKSDKYVIDSGDENNGTGDSLDEPSDDDNGDSDHKPVKKRRAKGSPPSEGKKRGGGGFNKPWALSESMAAICGENELSRPQV
jgi:hypothetical protein